MTDTPNKDDMGLQVTLHARDISDAPWDAGTWDKGVNSIAGAATNLFEESDVDAVLYHGRDADDWDGTEAAVVRLKDGRLAAWESTWGPTGSGFHEDAYGGDAVIWFAPQTELRLLVLQAMGDHGRELCGIPKGGLA